MKTPFWKMSGAGNDFVLIAGAPLGRAGASLARRLCDRRFGVGADGLLALSRKGKRVRLDYWNADGSAAFCGNGSRCAALWASAQGWVRGKEFILETAAGSLGVRLTGKGRAEVKMPSPRGFKKMANGVSLIDTGVPHAVVFVKNIEKADLKGLGNDLRWKHKANVDFIQVKNGTLHLRTFERGVEDETLACGTGVVAAAAVSFLLGKTRERVKVRVRGGDVLNVSLLHGGARLEGPGEITFTGEVTR
jgi:diaminopimelate epimerase